MKKVSYKNIETQKLIAELKRKSIETEAPIYKRLAQDLEISTRAARVVNLSKINRFTKENDFIVVPGKVLGAGELDHKITIAAAKFSSSALVKLAKAKAVTLPISDIIQKDIKGKKLRILG